jgi:hypothetical protein
VKQSAQTFDQSANVLWAQETLWILHKGYGTYSCELRYQGELAVEALILKSAELLVSHRFNTRDFAINWAELEKQHIEKGSN